MTKTHFDEQKQPRDAGPTLASPLTEQMRRRRRNQRGAALVQEALVSMAITALVILPLVSGAIIAGTTQVVPALDTTITRNRNLSD